LLKDVRSSELIEAVRTVAAGQALLSATITGRLIERFVQAGPRRRPPAAVAALTACEREVLPYIAEIAGRLDFDPGPGTASTRSSFRRRADRRRTAVAGQS
jgi:hypothetical protein